MKPLLISTACALAVASSALAADLRVALPTHITSMDPSRQWGNVAQPTLRQVFETLVERDPFTVPLEFRPGLATEWEQIEPTVWELKLRDGVQMHDGTTFDAEDVAFTYNRIWSGEDPEFTSPRTAFWTNFDRVEVIDPLTIRIHTKREDPLFLTLLSLSAAGITSKEHYEALGYEDAALNPIGSGPYQVTGFVGGERTEMARFDAYWGEPAPFDTITFTKVEEVASRIAGLASGDFDLIANIPPDQESTLDLPGIKTMGVTVPLYHVYRFNMKLAPTDDPKLRRAMRLCTDRQALVDGLWGGKAHVATAHQYEEWGEPMFDPSLELIKYDPEEAKRLIAESNYDGEPLVLNGFGNYYLYSELAAQVIQQQWQECGLNAQVRQVERVDWENDNIAQWSNPMFYPDFLGALEIAWAPNGVSSAYFDPQHPEWYETYDAVRFGTDFDERKAAFHKLLELSEEESGWMLLYEPHELYAMREGLSFEFPVAFRPYTLPFRAGEVTIADNF